MKKTYRELSNYDGIIINMPINLMTNKFLAI